MPHRTQNAWGISRSLMRVTVFLACGALSFFLGVQLTGDIDPVKLSIAQTPDTTQVNVVLQYLPVAGGTPRPIEITPFMNASQTALLQLQEIHSGVVAPPDAMDRCRTTNSVGRCNIRNVPVGPDPAQGIGTDQQYDITVDTVFIEYLTNIPLEPLNAFVRFNPAQCGGNATVFTGNTWCLTKPGGRFASEYFVTITLVERNVCLNIPPPAPFCDISGEFVNFVCNPSFRGPTTPWEPVASSCATVQCPDGNFVPGVCGEVVPGLATCATAAACINNQLCSVQNFGSSFSYNAGSDTIIIRGERFGAAGGSVSFPTKSGNPEVVQVFPGTGWTDTEIRVRVPLNAVSGVLAIHPNTHGFLTGSSGEPVPVTCASPPAFIRAFNDQFAILSINATTPDGIQLVSPGFDTVFTLIAQHNDRVGRLSKIVVELIHGSYPDANALPLRRTVITQTSCPVNIVGSAQAKEATLTCSVPVPQSAEEFMGPFTFVVTLFDNTGEGVRAVLLDSGRSALIGDFDVNGIISLADAVEARRLMDGRLSTTPNHLMRDTDGDGVITLADVLFVLHSLTR
jgi:hypothetical protein